MNRHDFFESKYLAKENITAPIRAHISHVQAEVLKSERGDERKPILHFTGGTPKAMVLNVINWTTIEEAYGEEVEGWSNKPIELYVDPNVMMGSKKVGGIRVRIPSDKVVHAGNGHAPSLMNINMALTALAAVGLTKDDLKRVITSKGHTGFMPNRDTPTVLAMIEEAQSNMGAEQSFDEAIPTNSEIPF
jgi:hypothetical protein